MPGARNRGGGSSARARGGGAEMPLALRKLKAAGEEQAHLGDVMNDYRTHLAAGARRLDGRGKAKADAVVAVAMSPPVYAWFDDELRGACAHVNAALTLSGVLEQRAVATGDASDAAAYLESLDDLDAAFAAWWALEARCALATRVAPSEACAALDAELAELDAARSKMGRPDPKTPHATAVQRLRDLDAQRASVRERRLVVEHARLPASALVRITEEPHLHVESRHMSDSRNAAHVRKAHTLQKLKAVRAARRALLEV